MNASLVLLRALAEAALEAYGADASVVIRPGRAQAWELGSPLRELRTTAIRVGDRMLYAYQSECLETALRATAQSFLSLGPGKQTGGPAFRVVSDLVEAIDKRRLANLLRESAVREASAGRHVRASDERSRAMRFDETATELELRAAARLRP